MTTYRVDVDGKTVYENKTKTYDRAGIPAEYYSRPETGTVEIYVDDELIGVQKPISAEEAIAIANARAVDLGEES